MEGTYNYEQRMVIKFCIDKTIDGEAYPNLATVDASPMTDKWKHFSTVTPFSEPVMLLKHLERCDIDVSISSVDNADNNTFYPIALSFFDFSINWFNLMSTELITKLKSKSVKILFYYSEGDNPYVIDEHIVSLCLENDIPREQVKFISANSEAKNIDHFYHVVDDELLFRYRNEKHEPGFYHEDQRSKKFTALVRMHKYWRANVMSTIWQQQFDTDGYFAYGNEITSGECENDNPIEVDKYVGLRQRTKTFLQCIPFSADTLSTDNHNNHTVQVREHFEDAYLNIVLESHMDVDQSNGVFLTEKTFKPIKNSQLFIIFGAAGSIQLLRDMGYKTFDHVIKHDYDKITNTTERWKSAMDETLRLLDYSNEQLRQIYIKCKDDIIHNQDLFHASKEKRLNILLKELVK